MPRNSLARSLLCASRRSRLARKLGVPVAALPDFQALKRASQAGVSRRQFLSGLTVAAAGLTLGRRASAHAGSAIAQPRIAIVGAGISGLTCALTLADNGIPSTVYEASSRVGGRMFSDNTGKWSENQVTEWCAEEIEVDHTQILSLATRFGLDVDYLPSASQAGQSDTYYFNSAYYSLADALQEFDPVLDKIDQAYAAAGNLTTYNTSTNAGRYLDNVSVSTWIIAHVPGGIHSRLGQLLSLIMVDECGGDANDLSALNLIYFFGGPGGPENAAEDGLTDATYHIRGGNELLPKSIAAYLAAMNIPIKTGMTMTAIEKTAGENIRMSFETSGAVQDIDSDIVVLTLPFAVLRSLDYRKANFDQRKQRAIRNLGRGVNGKLHLQFNQRLWTQSGPWGVSDGHSYSDTGYLTTGEPTRSQPGTSGILLNYTGGAFSKRQLSKTPFARVDDPNVLADAQNFLKQVEPVFPGLSAQWNGNAAQSLPHLSPFFNCSYSYWRVGQFQTVAGYEGVRQGNILFAGEHTSLEFQGFMEGGAEEGARAAREILTQLG